MIAVDSDSDTVLAVRRIVDGDRRVTVVLQTPVDGLVSDAARSTIADTDLDDRRGGQRQDDAQ